MVLKNLKDLKERVRWIQKGTCRNKVFLMFLIFLLFLSSSLLPHFLLRAFQAANVVSILNHLRKSGVKKRRGRSSILNSNAAEIFRCPVGLLDLFSSDKKAGVVIRYVRS